MSADSSNNVYLGSNAIGVMGESNTTRLGLSGSHLRTFAAGIRGTTTAVADAIPVMIDSNGQLGTISSSARFKEDIRDMGTASRRILNLRPVTFRYTRAYAYGVKPIQFGLVGEEVAEVFRDLVARGADGEIETVHYETLSVLLLNEVQRQHEAAGRQEQELSQQRERIEALEKRLDDALRGLQHVR